MEQSGGIRVNQLGRQASRQANALSKDYQLRRAVLLGFSESRQAQSELQAITEKEWRSLAHWLDVSGLALYFLDRLIQLNLTHLLPETLFCKLQRNLQENAERMDGMMRELSAIQNEFEAAALSYAVLKGASLWPHSVPRLELRHQFDLDFLLAEEDIADARQALERQGYRLYAVSGRSWEFKKDEKIGISMRDFYKDSAGRTVELHLQANVPGVATVLDRGERRLCNGIELPVLSPVDLFLGQGMHAYKHICGEFSRTAHLLEFYRHVLTRREDRTFWTELRSRGEGNARTSLALGVVTLLITNVMGEFAPRVLTDWTVERLPQVVKMWVSLYGNRVLFGDVPGSKLYLLLQRELEPYGHAKNRSLWRILLPRRLPPEVIRAKEGERMLVRVRRYRMQWKYVVLRLRFHVVEGFRYGREAYRWSKLRDEFTR